jgi:type IV pilus biogenesis/stability protein PilW
MAATRISLGLGYLKMGNMTQAKLNLEKAKTFSPELVQVHTAFAHYYEVVGENELTSQSYEKALSINANDADTLNNYGVFLCRQNKVAAAEVQFLKAIAVPSYLLVAQSYENLASCYLQIDDFIKAELYLDKAIDHSPNSTSTLLQMVRLQYAKADYAEAKRFQQKFERHTRRFTSDSLALAFKVYKKLGQRRTAQNYGAMLVKMYPQSWESKQYLLNELEKIDADNLAKRYQETKRQLERSSLKAGDSNKKRIVKLSPKSKTVKTLAPATSLAVVKSATPKRAESEVTNVASVATSPTVEKSSSPSKEILKTDPSSQSSLQQSSHEISAVLQPYDEPKVDFDESLLATTEGINALISADVNNEKDSLPEVGLSSPDSQSTEDLTTNHVLTTKSTEDSQFTAEDYATESIAEDGTLVKTVLVSPQATLDEEDVTTLNGEPTSTAPTPAKRDVPLPEAIELVAVEKEGDVQTEIPADEPTLVEETNERNKLEAEITPNEEANADASTAVNEPVNVIERVSDESEMNDREKDSDNLVNERQTIFHQVSDGETLYAISVKYNVKLKALREWNKLSNKHKLQIKEKIYVVNPETVTDINE